MLSHLLWTIAIMLVIGLPLIRSTTRLPRVLQFATVEPTALTAPQAEFFRQHDEKLGAMGYYPGPIYSVPNLSGRNLSRVYFNSSEATFANVATLTSAKGQRGLSYVEFITRYQDGSSLTTKNADISTVFPLMPGRVSQNFPGVTDLAELKRRHEARRASLTGSGEVFVNEKDFFTRFQDAHQKWADYQVQRGVLRSDPAVGYRGTLLLGLRGVRNYLNPFADNFTFPRFAAGVICGLGLPLLAILNPGNILQAIQWQGSTPAQTHLLVLLVAYVLAGAVVGYLFTGKSFIWAFLLGYVSWLVFPQHTNVAYVLVMTVVAHQVAVWRFRRQRLV